MYKFLCNESYVLSKNFTVEYNLNSYPNINNQISNNIVTVKINSLFLGAKNIIKNNKALGRNKDNEEKW
jgi:hypothetical protein